MALVLRPGRITDLPLVYRGEEAYIRAWEPAHENAWRLQMERHLTSWVENIDRLTVAEVDGMFAGYSLWMSEQDHAELCTISVSDAYRRNGIGRALLEAYMASAAAQGFTRLGLHVRPDNPAVILYEHAGFVHAGASAQGYLRYQRSC
ncbi:ribosomal protein S18 acetylase RimI-like enzyme [Pseudomonas sp. BIGb0408]|uniref:Ribosomal protein S18 acetylase RimI-like enzyme n=1 Tax=Phytopseudomonas flavescens TaxID=29435 RepID=A0A7Z0BQH0_9GAMM|nr:MULTISPECIES: GNAT family N-acetyltransferase [Pseudomonas]MCW2290422.1 ribosomal protein S18 acetylase RimI-like enzyme [Pseudomonas sp. BIGb0408]NYH75005.1 ribosomal protein S18 acetylase RimI-like enzyme [Pseudomonas flavescens]